MAGIKSSLSCCFQGHPLSTKRADLFGTNINMTKRKPPGTWSEGARRVDFKSGTTSGGEKNDGRETADGGAREKTRKRGSKRFYQHI